MLTSAPSDELGGKRIPWGRVGMKKRWIAFVAACVLLSTVTGVPSTPAGAQEVPTCNGLEATIVGTEGDDVLQGTNKADVIVGLGGNDTITGGNGDDVICGGDGDDTIEGGNGKDTIHGGNGNDTIEGGNGTDDLDGGNGTDTVDGGRANDTCDDAETAIGCETETNNGEEIDAEVLCAGLTPTIVGTDGADDLVGTNDADVIVGLGGNDEIDGLAGNDVICGGDGDDVIDGSTGSDVIVGGVGTDACDDGSATECEAVTNIGSPDSYVFRTPYAGAVIFESFVPIVDGIDAGVGWSAEVTLGGASVGTFPLSSALPEIDLSGVAIGPTTLTIRVFDANGLFQGSAQQPIVVDRFAGGVSPLVELEQRFDDGSLDADAFLTNGMRLLGEIDSAEGGSEDEITPLVLNLALQLWDQASPEARNSVLAMGGVYEEVPQISALRASSCDFTEPLTWVLGQIVASTFCEFRFSPADLGRTDPSLVDIVFFVDPDLDDDDLGLGNVDLDVAQPAGLVAGAQQIWDAQLLFQDRGFELPDTHRAGTPLHIFIVDNTQPAYSSPFDENSALPTLPILGLVNTVKDLTGRDVGHPIRISGPELHLRRTVVHELFHTFEWDNLKWERDVLLAPGNDRGEVVAFYESAANWGTHEFQGVTGYHAGRAATYWLNDPTQGFLWYPDDVFNITNFPGGVIAAGREAYAYFPGLVWLDQKAGNNLLASSFDDFDDFQSNFVVDPIEAIEEEVQLGPFARDEGEPFAQAWPRMWTALYLMQNSPQVGSAEYPWAFFDDAEVQEWRDELPAPSTNLLGSENRLPAHPASPFVFSGAGSMSSGEFTVEAGGASLVEVVAPPGVDSTASVRVVPADSGRTEKFEAAVVRFDASGFPSLCDDGTDAILESDSEKRGFDGAATFEVPLSAACPFMTVLAVHVDPNSRRDSGRTVGSELLETTVLMNVGTPAPVITTTTTVPTGASGSTYPGAMLNANLDVVWDVISGGLPDGLSLNSATGAISGTPNGGGSYPFTVEATSLSGQTTQASFVMTVSGPLITTDALDRLIENGDAASQSLTAEVFGTIPPVVFTVDQDSLPAGVSLSPGGQLSGIATESGDFDLVIRATDDNGRFHDKTLTLTVDSAALQVAATLDAPLEPGVVRNIDVVVTNTAAAPASNVVVVVRLADGFTSVVAPGCSLIAGTVNTFSCSVGDLAADASATVPVSFDVPVGVDSAVEFCLGADDAGTVVDLGIAPECFGTVATLPFGPPPPTYEQAVGADSPFYQWRFSNGDPLNDLGGGDGAFVSVDVAAIELASETPGTNDGAVLFVDGSDPTAGEVSNELSVQSSGYTLETWLPLNNEAWELVAGPVSLESIADSPELVATFAFSEGQEIVLSHLPSEAADAAVHVVVTLSFESLGCDDSGLVCFVEWRAALYVNGQLIEEGTNGGLDSEVGFALSALITFPTGVAIDETAIYDNHLTAARVLAHYNAAING